MNNPTIRELQKQLGQLNLLVEETKQREKQAILAEIGAHVKEYGITEIELLRAAGFVQTKRQKAPAMYYDPESHGLAKVCAPSGSSTRISMTI